MATENPALHAPVLTAPYAPPAEGRTDAKGNAIKNHVLTTIPESEFSKLQPHFEFLDLDYHQNLFASNNDVEYAYFLNRGMISLVVTTSDGRSVEVGVVGREGAVGTGLVVDLTRSPYRAVVQIPGDGMRLPGSVIRNLQGSIPEFERMLNRYAAMQGMQVAQLAACNRLHEIEQRLARWMLMCHDRIESDLLPM